MQWQLVFADPARSLELSGASVSVIYMDDLVLCIRMPELVDLPAQMQGILAIRTSLAAKAAR
eukprot:470324-Amphidinium_carterae.2